MQKKEKGQQPPVGVVFTGFESIFGGLLLGSFKLLVGGFEVRTHVLGGFWMLLVSTLAFFSRIYKPPFRHPLVQEDAFLLSKVFFKVRTTGPILGIQMFIFLCFC